MPHRQQPESAQDRFDPFIHSLALATHWHLGGGGEGPRAHVAAQTLKGEGCWCPGWR